MVSSFMLWRCISGESWSNTVKAIKPRVKKSPYWFWICTHPDFELSGYGSTPTEAYHEWWKENIALIAMINGRSSVIGEQCSDS